MKKIILILPLGLILCFMLGCQDKAAMAELEKYRAQAKVEEQNKVLVERYFGELKKGNFDVLNEMNAPEYLFYSPSTNPKPMTREQTIEFIKMIFAAFPDINYRIEKVYVDGDTAIIWYTVTGTHQGEFAGIPATGNKVKVSSILLWSIKDGKIIEEREEADMLGLMMQLGMELKPKEEK